MRAAFGPSAGAWRPLLYMKSKHPVLVCKSLQIWQKTQTNRAWVLLLDHENVEDDSFERFVLLDFLAFFHKLQFSEMKVL